MDKQGRNYTSMTLTEIRMSALKKTHTQTVLKNNINVSRKGQTSEHIHQS